MLDEAIRIPGTNIRIGLDALLDVLAAKLDDLDEEALMRILTEPKNALVRQYQRLFEMEDVQLTFAEEALRAKSEELSRINEQIALLSARLKELEVRAQIAIYAVVRTYERIMTLHGWEAAAAHLRRAWERRDRAGMQAAVTDDMVDTIAVAGTRDEVRQQLMEGAARHYHHVLLYPPSFGLTQARLAENVEALIDTFAEP